MLCNHGEHEDWCIKSVGIIVTCEEKVTSSSTIGVGFGEIQYICVDSQDHVAGNKFEGCKRVSSNVVKELVAGLLDCLCAFPYVGSYGA